MYLCFFCFLCGTAGIFFAYEDFIGQTVRAIIEPRFNFMAMRTHAFIHDGLEKNVTAENYAEASAWMKKEKENRFMATRFSVMVYKNGRFYVRLTSDDPEQVPFMSDVTFFFKNVLDKMRSFAETARPGASLSLYDDKKKRIRENLFPKRASVRRRKAV